MFKTIIPKSSRNRKEPKLHLVDLCCTKYEKYSIKEIKNRKEYTKYS